MSRDALVVGINTYQDDKLHNLTAPAADAEAIAQITGLSVAEVEQLQQESSARKAFHT